MARTDKIIQAFRHAKRINEALWGFAEDSATVSLKSFHDIIQEEFGSAIELFSVKVENDFFVGAIERYPDQSLARVYIARNLSDEWRRLVIVKELCHALLDSQDAFQVDGVDTLLRMIQGTVLDLDAPENQAFLSEHIAEMAAWELLYPFELRKIDLAKSNGDKPDIQRLSRKYELPAEVIVQLLTPPYLAFCEKYWAIVTKPAGN